MDFLGKMAEWTSVARQIVNPGEAIVFTENPVRCTKGLIKHLDDSGLFNLNGSRMIAFSMTFLLELILRFLKAKLLG